MADRMRVTSFMLPQDTPRRCRQQETRRPREVPRRAASGNRAAAATTGEFPFREEALVQMLVTLLRRLPGNALPLDVEVTLLVREFRGPNRPNGAAVVQRVFLDPQDRLDRPHF